jgi:hypothetical protein
VAPASLVFDKDKVPEKLQIKTLEKEFKPADFPHQKIVAKLTKISNESSLAKVFHAGVGDQALCSGCHHKTDPAAAQAKKVPTCRMSQPTFRSAELQPGILAHTIANALGVMKPAKTRSAGVLQVSSGKTLSRGEAATSGSGRTTNSAHGRAIAKGVNDA